MKRPPKKDPCPICHYKNGRPRTSFSYPTVYSSRKKYSVCTGCLGKATFSAYAARLLSGDYPPPLILPSDFAQFLVDQAPKFDEEIMKDITISDGWLLNVSKENYEPPRKTHHKIRRPSPR